MENIAFERKKLEYNAAQEMLRHYDLLNWQIGAILVAATIILTGLMLRREVIDLIRAPNNLSCVVVLGIPIFSFVILRIWLEWYRRHRDMYNLRNETLQRLELDLGMYHYLRVVEADMFAKCGVEPKLLDKLKRAKLNAGYSEDLFTPFYPHGKFSSRSGYFLAHCLAYCVPVSQFLLFVGIKFA